MADHRDPVTHTTPPPSPEGTTRPYGATPDTTATANRPGYSDPLGTTETMAPRRAPATRRGTSWIGAIAAVLALVIVGAWFAGAFSGPEQNAMMVGDPGVQVLEENAVIAPATDDSAVVPAVPAQE